METDGALIEWSVRGRADAFVEVVRRHEHDVPGESDGVSPDETRLGRGRRASVTLARRKVTMCWASWARLAR